MSSKQMVEFDKEEFLKTYNGDYGYSGGPLAIDQLRATEFKRLESTIYLDHAGATLYSESQIHAIMLDYSAQLYGNPHSQSRCSTLTVDAIESARQQVLDFLNAPKGKYRCIFTSGATAALKLVGEAFPWTSSSKFCYTMENHNSVLGIREYALSEGATAMAVDVEVDSNKRFSMKPRTLQKRGQVDNKSAQNACAFNLFAFPSECNFSGERFDLNLIPYIQKGQHTINGSGQWMVLLDAAKGSATSPPDLSCFPADFVAISFYKIFGYPTGLGALVIRQDAAKILKKKYFSGGTVAVSIADIDFAQRRQGIEEWLEDGTASFLSVAALKHGFETINKIGIDSIRRHTHSLTSYTANKLDSLRHSNGARVCVLYRNHNAVGDQGPILTFNLKSADGSWIGYREVEQLASLHGIDLRGGCFCNPGACAKYLDLSIRELQLNFEEGHVCWDDRDIIHGKPSGAVRVSLGYMSTFEDCQALFHFLKSFFADEVNFHQLNTRGVPRSTKTYLHSIIIYPIKSCAGFAMKSWPLGDCGLLYDREWLIVNDKGVVLTQKKVPSMCLLQTYIDLKSQKMTVKSPQLKDELVMSLLEDRQEREIESIFLCGERTKGRSSKAYISDWLTKALNLPCHLVRRETASRQIRRGKGQPQCHGRTHEGKDELSFANEGQYLLVSKSSIQDLNERLQSSYSKAMNCEVDPLQFRPNFIVSGCSPYEEDAWEALTICENRFVVLGGCNRCQMINIDWQTGCPHPKSEPLTTLAAYRRNKGKICFGILLKHEQIASYSDEETHGIRNGHHLNKPYRILTVGREIHTE